MSEPNCLSRHDASLFLGVSTRTIDRLPLPRVKIGRRTVYLQADIAAFVEANRKLPVRESAPATQSKLVREAATKIAERIRAKAA